MSVDDDPGAARPGQPTPPDAPGQSPLWGPRFAKPGQDDVPAQPQSPTGPQFVRPGQQPQAGAPSGPIFTRPGQSPEEAYAAQTGAGGPVFVKVDEPTDEERPWAWYVGLVAVVVAFVAVILMSFAVVIPATMLSSTDSTKFADQNEHWFGLGQDVLWIAVALVVPFLFAHHLRAGQLGMRRPPRWWKAIAVFVAAIVVFYGLAAAYASILGLDDNSNTLLDDNSGFGNSLTKDIAYALLYTVAAPIAEELLFRGLLFRTIRDGLSKRFRKGGVWYAAIISGAIFGAIHYTPGPVNQNKFIPVLMMLGIVLALAYSFSGTIYVNIAIHAINNALATGTNTNPTQDWIFVLIAAGPLIAIAVTFLISRFVRATFRADPPNRARPPSAEPAIV